MPLRRCETASIETNVGVFVLNLWLTAHVGGNCLFLFFFFAASSHHNNSISHSDRHHNNSAKIHIQIRVNARDTQTAHYRKRTHDCIAYIIYLLPFFFFCSRYCCCYLVCGGWTVCLGLAKIQNIFVCQQYGKSRPTSVATVGRYE